MQLIKHVSPSGPSLLTALLWEALLLSQPVTGVTPVKPLSLSPGAATWRLDTWLTGVTLVSQQAAQHHWTWHTGSAGVPILILKAKGNCRNFIFHSKFCQNPMFVQITSEPWREPKTWGNVLSLSESHFQILTNQGHFRKNTSALFLPG